MCEQEKSEAHSCAKCRSNIHVIYGTDIVIGEKGFGSEVMCSNCNTEAKISQAWQAAADSLKQQAKRINRVSDASHPPPGIEQNATAPIPEVDREKDIIEI